MITEEFFVYFMFQMVIMAINLVGYTRIPALSAFGIGFTLAIMVQTISAFGDYAIFGIMLILLNLTLPIYALTQKKKG